MKAYLLRRYGPAEALERAEIDRPEPAAGEVLIRVLATSINPFDWHNMRGEPRIARLMPGGLGLRAPGIDILGCDVCGVVEAVGDDVNAFRPGDEVIALLPRGGHAEYVTVSEQLVARAPAGLDPERAAVLPMAGVTALLALTTGAGVDAGHRVLVTGAAGGVGHLAVQLAVAIGAHVTAVGRATNLSFLESLGAHEVVDGGAHDVTRREGAYDAVVDISGSRSVRELRRTLVRDGALVVVGGPAGRWVQPAGHAMSASLGNPFVSQRMGMVDTVGYPRKREVLDQLVGFVESGAVAPMIHERYSFDRLPEAITRQEAGGVPGKLAVAV
jgi:NADPH:quinone reductase-like Zn-dependent oxidoreductase